MLLNIYLARHAETAWSVTGQHTGLTDIPLTERGEGDARRLGQRLRGITFEKVYMLLFSSGHFLRVLATRWLDIETIYGTFFLLSSGSVSTLGYDKNRNQPAILLWNDTSHLSR
jgi:broad specificity phosphatase PhoE